MRQTKLENLNAEQKQWRKSKKKNIFTWSITIFLIILLLRLRCILLGIYIVSISFQFIEMFILFGPRPKVCVDPGVFELP